MGTAAGANADQVASGTAQHRYDLAYQQCMYAKGNQIPGWRRDADTPPPPDASAARPSRLFADAGGIRAPPGTPPPAALAR